MKLSRVITIIGVFFLAMQFSTVFLFNSMMTIAKNQSLPSEQLERLQIIIMNVVLFSLIGLGIMFLILLAALIWNAFKQYDRAESDPV